LPQFFCLKDRGANHEVKLSTEEMALDCGLHNNINIHLTALWDYPAEQVPEK